MVRPVYTSSNTHFGTIRENDFGKDFNKILSNSVFGKSLKVKEMKKIYLLLRKEKIKKKEGEINILFQ